ncbi:MAG: carboxylating nicotinate-nucleotide diphosphorylase [Flavobacteriaceae bacterium]|nr:carboxylating nicotinate-nucleotide diphosphorylase [Flavobacteriaceae bacterium]
MMNNFLNQHEEALYVFINHALSEDIGQADHSTRSTIASDALGTAQLIMKQEGVLAGLELAKMIFNTLDKKVILESNVTDGDWVNPGTLVCTVSGSVHTLLAAERVVLNCMQRMSGIATFTRSFQEKISHTNCKVLDTRKTTPNFRIPEKWAVSIGGGTNHRFGLYDAIMIKDNHIDFNGSIEAALESCKSYLQINRLELPVIVETRNIDEVRQCIAVGGMNRILLDNMTPEQIAKILPLIPGSIETEASGNIDLNNVVEYAETGVDFVSVGAITHSAIPLDMSLVSG